MFAHSSERPHALNHANLAFQVYVTSIIIVAVTFAMSVVAKHLGWGDPFAQGKYFSY